MASRLFGTSRRNSTDGSATPQRRRSSITEVFTGSRRRSSSGAGDGDAAAASHHVNRWVDVEGHGIGRIVAFHKAALSRMPGIHNKYDVDFSLGGQHKLLKLHLKKKPRTGDAGDAGDEPPHEPAADPGADKAAENSLRKRRSTFSGLQYSICPPAVAASWQSALDMGFTSKADHDACVEMGFISRSRYEHCLGMGFTKKEDYDECFRMGFDDRLEFEESKELGLTSKEAYVASREARVRQQKLENSRRNLEKQRAAAIALAEGEGEGEDVVEKDLESMRRAFDGILKKWTLKEVAAAWRRWMDAAETARHAIAFIKKWTLKEVAAAWRRWRRAVQLSRIATGILKKWHNRRVVAAWRQWWMFIDFTRITERILAKWQNRLVGGAWRRWWVVIEDLRKEEAERALKERVQALEKAAAKMTAKLKEKEDALQRSERQLAREVAARKKLDGERAKQRKRKKDVEARRKGYASWEDYESCREMGFTSIEERDEFLRLGFQVKSEYDEFVEMGFRGLCREAFDECLSLGFENRSDYEAFKNSEFAEKTTYDECKQMGFASKEEYDHCKEVGYHSKSEYDKYMAIRSARIKVRRLHRKHPTEFASGHYCMLRDILLSTFGEGYDPHGPAPEVVLQGMSEPIIIGKAKVSTRVRWEHPSAPEAVQVGCRVRLSDGREGEVTNVRKWSFSCDVTLANSEATTQLVRCDDLEIAVVGSLRSIEFDRQILSMLFPARATTLGDWHPPSFTVVGACAKAASVLAIPWTPIVNCLHDGRVSVIETSKSVASGKNRVRFEGTVHGFNEDSGLYHFRSDGDLDVVQKDFEPQADGVGEVVSTEPSARYQIGTKLLVYRSSLNGGRWIPAEITQVDTEGCGRPLHEIELAESLSDGSPTRRRIDLNCANHGLCISTNDGEWDFESSIEAFFGKLSTKYGSLEDDITGGKVHLRKLAAARFNTSKVAGGVNDVRVLAREMLDTERSDIGGLCHRQVILTGNGKTLASLQLVLEIIDLQRHQRSPPPDIPLYVSVQRLSRGVNAPKVLSLSKYFESDDFTVEEGLLLRQALELRRLIIVLDGIDEAAGRFNTTWRLAEALASAGHRCVVTTRVESLKDTSAKKHLQASSHFSQLDLMPMAEDDRWTMVDQQVLELAQAKGSLLKSMEALRGATGADDSHSSSVVDNFYGDKAADGKLELLIEVAQDPTLMSMIIAGLQNGNAQGKWAPSSIGHLHEATVNAVLSKEPKGNGRTYRLLKELATKAHMQRKGEFNASMLSGDCLRALGTAWKSAGKALPLLKIVVAPARDSSINGGVFKFKQLALQEYLAAKQLSEDLLNRDEGGIPRGIAVDKVWGKTEEVLALLNDDWYSRMMRLAFEELGSSRGLLFDVLSSALTSDSAMGLGNGRLKSWAVFSKLFRSNQTVVSLNLSKCADLGHSLGDGGLRKIVEVLESTAVAEIDLSGSDIAGDVVVLEEFKSFAGRLRTLSMQGCSRISGDIRVFKHFPVIQSLVLYDTACYGNVEVFAATPALEKLWLSGTSCSGSIQIFHSLKHLRVLGLQETECEGSEPDIRAALPRCSITFTLMPNGTRALPLFSPAKLKSGRINSSGKLPPNDRTSPWLARGAVTPAIKPAMTSATKSAATSARNRDSSSSESEVVAAARRRLQF